MMRRIFLTTGLLVFGVFLLGCNTTTTTPTVLPTGTVTTTATVTTQKTESDLELQLLAIYQLATGSGTFTGTYEEWLETVRGPQGIPGEDGREVLLRVEEGFLQWKYAEEETWTDLLDLSTLAGAQGPSGREIVLRVAEGSLEWQYSGDESWIALVSLSALTGAAGREISLQVADGALQWQYAGEETWHTLLDLSVLTGTVAGSLAFQVSGGFIQWKSSESGEWQNLIALDSLAGAPGEAGESVTFQVSDGYIQWKYVGEDNWIDLVELATLTGPAGEDGKEILLQVIDGVIQWQHDGDETWQNLVDIATLTGSDGEDGKEVTFRIFGGYVQWQYVGDEGWTDLIDLASLTGQAGEDGLSAYEIYMKYYPDYPGDEEQWINDLINGRLGTADEAYLLSYFDMGDINFYALASGGEHCLAISVEGDLYAWGSNEYGQLGDGTTIDRKVPVNITGNLGLSDGESVLSLACGFYDSYVLTSEKRVLVWGYNDNGELGNGTQTESHLPIDVTGFLGLSANETVEEIIPGFYHVYVITSENRVLAWGMDSMDQLGTPELDNELLPIDLTPAFGLAEGETIVSISAGGWHNLALSSEGRVFAWGNNEYGQVGTGDLFTVPVPTEITSRLGLSEGEAAVSLIAGSRHSFAITSSGRILAWGDNSRSQLGMAVLGMSVVDPADVTGCFDLEAGETVAAISAMGDYSLALTSEGRLFSWGNNYFGQLGDGTTRNRSTPGDITYTFNLGEGETLIQIADGHFHSLALSSSGRLFAWGNNDYGQLGDGTLVSESLADDLTVWVPIWREYLYYGSALGYPITPVRTGFSFMGWYYEPTFETRSVNALMTAGNVDLYARWELLDVYLVTYDTGDEGSHVLSTQVTENDYLFRPETDPVRTGYTFSGWFEDPEGTVLAVFPAVVTSDLTLHAGWTVNQYTLSFDSNGGSLIEARTQDFRSAVAAPADPEKTGFTFAGWYSDVGLSAAYAFSTMPAENLTLFAKWSRNLYTISFDSEGGSPVDPITDYYAYSVSAPADPSRTGYSFGGWYSDEGLTEIYSFVAIPAENITVHAKWTINQYTLTFNSNGGCAVAPITQDYGTAVSAPADPDRMESVFSGWYSDPGLTTPYVFSTMPAENLALYAKWTMNQYTLSFDSNGGSAVAAITQDYGTEVTSPADPVREGYVFAGWYSDPELTTAYVFTTMPAENLTLYAKWS